MRNLPQETVYRLDSETRANAPKGGDGALAISTHVALHTTFWAAVDAQKVGKTEDAHAYRLAFANLVSGIPDEVLHEAACEHCQWLSAAHNAEYSPDDVLGIWGKALRWHRNQQGAALFPNETPVAVPAPVNMPTVEEISEIAADEARVLDRQIAAETDADDRAFLCRERNALNKAVLLYAKGSVCVYEDARGDLLMSSATRSETVHRVSRHGGLFVCTCEAHASGNPCWHVALAQLIDAARERRNADAGVGMDTEYIIAAVRRARAA